MPNKPVAANVHRMRGTYRHRRHNDSEQPQPDALKARCPAWMNADGRKEWRRVLPALVQHKVLSETDLAVFTTYCQEWGKYVEGERIGEPLPAARVTAMRMLMVEIGLTPSARTRLRAEAKAAESDPGLERFA